ncbi:MAG: zinc ABC transporter substrate-binding protein, partial [Rhodospirillaceae bacterium]|nr:zinc ABC transporter substrate-binding protein [Rhodospirillaceae bacterium]
MKFKQLALAVIAVLISAPTARAVETKGVVVTIKPLHSLVSGVVGNTGKTHLLVSGNSSPHGFKFKPSQ